VTELQLDIYGGEHTIPESMDPKERGRLRRHTYEVMMWAGRIGIDTERYRTDRVAAHSEAEALATVLRRKRWSEEIVKRSREGCWFRFSVERG